MQANNYLNFSTEDFLADDDFIRYVKYKQTADVQFWRDWTAQNPANLNAFKNAETELAIILSAKDLPVPADLTTSLWDEIESSIQKQQRRKKVIQLRNIWLSGVAAILACVAYGGWYLNSNITISTNYGEQKAFTLPDGSQVRLNANSSITYPRAFNWEENRHVSIKGEAYFDVKHINQNAADIKDGERFIAESEQLRVEVLGTIFNLKSRPNVNQVTLVRGKVSVKSIASGEERILKPGELVKLDDRKRFMLDANANIEPQVSWTGNKMLMTQTRVGDIIAEFENLYGYKVILPDTALANKLIDGTISTASEESVLFVLKNILNVNVRQEGKTIYLEKR